MYIYFRFRNDFWSLCEQPAYSAHQKQTRLKPKDHLLRAQPFELIGNRKNKHQAGEPHQCPSQDSFIPALELEVSAQKQSGRNKYKNR
jgi:hypothetical protein